MPFKKYVVYHLGKTFHEDKKMILGTFKDLNTGKIIRKDDFKAHIIGKGTAKETYKAYLEWYNYTIEKGDSKREYVTAKWFV